MERLTVATKRGLGLECCSQQFCMGECNRCTDLEDVVKKLQELEDSEEAGLLIKLPVAVGKTVYSIEDKYKGKKVVGCKIVEFSIDSFVIGDSITPVARGCSEENCWTDFEMQDFGKNVFLTREEAEKALEAVK